MTEEEKLNAIATVQYQLGLLAQFDLTEDEIVKHSVDQVQRVDGKLVGRVLYENKPVNLKHDRPNIVGRIAQSFSL